MYPVGICKATTTIFQKLEEINVFVPQKDCYYPFFTSYDFECFLIAITYLKHSEILSFEAHHVPLSMAIASNVPGREEAVCLVFNGDFETLVQDMLRHMEAISESAYEILKKIFSNVYDALKDHTKYRSENL